MDVHRCRFVHFPPAAINVLAFTHSSGSGSHNQPLRLAIGRANGDIEIWDPRRGTWIHQTTFRGGRDRSIEGLAWIQNPDETDENGYVINGRLRLFSIGYSNSVTEWDLCSGLPRGRGDAGSSEIWCLAAQPRWRPTTGSKKQSEPRLTNDEDREQCLVAGCADGSLVLLSTSDDEVHFQRYIARAPKKTARALSITFQNRNTVVVGFADSVIRVHNIRNGNLIRTMSLGGGPRGAPRDTLVWAVECLKNGDIVSGDSNGEVIFWDGQTYGQTQRIKGHEADTLCLATSEDGGIIFSGGMDRRTVAYALQTTGQRTRWHKTAHQRLHQHDVKAMARFENSKMSLVVSGGLDTHPILTPLRAFGREHHRKLPYTPQISPVACARRLIVSWWNNDITIWHLNRQNVVGHQPGNPDPEKNYSVAVRMMLKDEENITSVAISPSGKVLAVATSAQVKVFHLIARKQKPGYRIKRIEVPTDLYIGGARLVQFSPDSRWLLSVHSNNTITLTRLIVNLKIPHSAPVISTKVVLRRPNRPHDVQNSLNGSWGSYDLTITRASFSHDSRLLAVSDLAGYINSWRLQGEEDLKAPATQMVSGPSPHSTLDNLDSDMDSRSGSESDSNNVPRKRKVICIYGQSWLLNSQVLPRLPSCPLIFSFRPSAKNYKLAANGRNLEIVEDRLFILTSSHEMYEFRVLQGQLTPWSRRNFGALPDEFKLQRDRAVGCVWDIAGHRERIWVYGASWLAMFDLAQDFPISKTVRDEISGPERNDQENGGVTQKERHQSTKRKRSDAATKVQLQLKSNTSGASGSRIRDDELGGGIASRKMRKLDSDGKAEPVDLIDEMPQLPQKGIAESEDDEDMLDVDNDEVHTTQTLRELRRAEKVASSSKKKAAVEESVKLGSHVVTKPKSRYTNTKKSQAFYITNRYRPILGLVALNDDADFDEVHDNGTELRKVSHDQSRPLEVALIERPLWDVDLPARFYGNQEWEK